MFIQILIQFFDFYFNLKKYAKPIMRVSCSSIPLAISHDEKYLLDLRKNYTYKVYFIRFKKEN